MCICDSVLASILGSKAGNSLIKCLPRIGDIAKHTLQLVTPYTLGKKVQIYLQVSWSDSDFYELECLIVMQP